MGCIRRKNQFALGASCRRRLDEKMRRPSAVDESRPRGARELTSQINFRNKEITSNKTLSSESFKKIKCESHYQIKLKHL